MQLHPRTMLLTTYGLVEIGTGPVAPHNISQITFIIVEDTSAPVQSWQVGKIHFFAEATSNQL